MSACRGEFLCRASSMPWQLAHEAGKVGPDTQRIKKSWQVRINSGQVNLSLSLPQGQAENVFFVVPWIDYLQSNISPMPESTQILQADLCFVKRCSCVVFSKKQGEKSLTHMPKCISFPLPLCNVDPLINVDHSSGTMVISCLANIMQGELRGEVGREL